MLRPPVVAFLDHLPNGEPAESDATVELAQLADGFSGIHAYFPLPSPGTTPTSSTGRSVRRS
jgi:hypothetical protein